jgi:hypothetical protein
MALHDEDIADDLDELLNTRGREGLRVEYRSKDSASTASA